MDEPEQDGSSVRLNPQLCARLRQRREPQPACSQAHTNLKRLVGNTVVQRLRQANHQLAVEEFLGQLDPAPQVPQETALSYYIRRTYNSLRSREMLAKEAKEAARLRREPFEQTLAKDISRRHFRTVHRYDTGSKYPAATNSGRGGERDAEGLAELDAHGHEAREAVLTLLRSRKLMAMAEVLLSHPGSVRVGPQLTSPGEGKGGGDAGAAAAANEDNVGPAAVSDLAVPYLEATRYVLARFSPGRDGGRAAPDEAAAAGGGEEARGRSRRARAAARVRTAGPGHESGGGSSGTHASSMDQRTDRRRAGRRYAASSSDPGDAADEGGAPVDPFLGGAGAGAGALRHDDLHSSGDGGAVDLAACACAPEPGEQKPGQSSDGAGGAARPPAAPSVPAAEPPAPLPPPAAAAAQLASAGSATTDWVLPSGGGYRREAMPVGVQHRLMEDRLRDLMAATRSLWAQAEGLLGAAAAGGSGAPLGGTDGATVAALEGGLDEAVLG